MSDWKAAEQESYRDSLYIEELNSNDGTSRRITGIKTTDTVETLKRRIATDLRNPQGWNSLAVAFAGQDLNSRMPSFSKA
jgi:hypothetical protein